MATNATLIHLISSLKASIDNIQRDIDLLSATNLPTTLPSTSSSFSSLDVQFSFNSGDTAWMLIATCLVFGMTVPGIMLYYSGMVKLQNALSTSIQGFGLACMITFLWLCFGYSLSFTPIEECDSKSILFGDSSRFWLHDLTKLNQRHQLAPTVPESIFCCYQLCFAIITPCLICGAFADRMKYTSVLVALGLWHLVVYCPMAHSNWHPNGFLHQAGVLDFAGGNVVHIAAGTSALIATLIVGKRHETAKNIFPAHNLLLSLIGSCSLIMGWYGFNAGSTFKANEIAGFAAMNSQIAGALSSLSWMILDILTTGRPTLDGVMNGFTTELIFFTPYVGTIAGLVGITPAVGYVTPSGALVIGIVSGIGCHYGIKVKTLFNFDDSLDAFGIHAVAGIAGGVLTGLLAHVHEAQGTFHGNTKQVGIQLFGITITILWSAVGTAVVFFLVDALFGLRVSKESEAIGLDLVLHGNTITQQASKATRKERPEDQDICCRLHCPCLVFIIRRPNNQPESTSI